MEKITFNSPESKSPDFVAENIALLKELFPELLTEGKDGTAVNLDVLKSLVGDKTVTDAEEKYGLNWHGKRCARQLSLTPSTGTLRPCPEDSVEWDNTQNLMIEGDNLEVLKLLQKSFASKIRMIYIDPPYNTGTDRIYPDDFHNNIENYLQLTGQAGEDRRISISNPESSGRFHTDWLNMMYPRLKIARNLLRDDGAIFISIDDHELDNLRKLCDEIFGSENHIEDLVWAQNTTHSQSPLYSTNHEFILVYARNAALLESQADAFREPKPGYQEIMALVSHLNPAYPSTAEVEAAIASAAADHKRQYEDELVELGLDLDDETEKLDPWRGIYAYRHVEYRDGDGNVIDDSHARDAAARIIVWQSGDGSAPAAKQSPSTKDPESPNFRFYKPLHPQTGMPCPHPKTGWRWPKSWPDTTRESFDALQKKQRIVWGADERSVPRYKRFLHEVESNVAKSFFSDYTDGEKQVAELFGQAALFPNPKPTSLVERFLSQVCKADDVVLDFFAGSGTTGHAVMAYNAAWATKLRFLLVQLPEPLDPTNKDQRAAADFCKSIKRPTTIAEITKERLRRAGRAIREQNPGFEGDLGFRIFRLDSSNINAWEPDRMDLPKTLDESVEHLKTDRTESDILFELLLKLGLDLCVPLEKRSIMGKDVHSIGGGVLFACLAEDIAASDIETLAQAIIAWHEELTPAGDTTCVFRDSAFADDVAKVNLTAILEQAGLTKVRSL